MPLFRGFRGFRGFSHWGGLQRPPAGFLAEFPRISFYLSGIPDIRQAKWEERTLPAFLFSASSSIINSQYFFSASA